MESIDPNIVTRSPAKAPSSSSSNSVDSINPTRFPAKAPSTSTSNSVDEREIISEVENYADISNIFSVPVLKETPKTNVTQTFQTPDGSQFFVPIVDYKRQPVIGRNYGSLERCRKMYHEYAYYSGFEIRKGSQKTNLSGIVRQKYYLCHRAGERKKVNIDSLERNEKQVRKSSMESTGCKARVRFDLDYLNETYIIADFHAIHNHELVPREYRHLCKTDRQLKYAEQLFVYNASISNVGPTKAHQLYSNLKGSSLNVNGTVDDFRNWKRDLNVYINESDAQILVNKMMEMREHIPGFAFEYKVDKSELHSLFWADNVARRNYEEFSDIMSFDATYRTNRYNMMFVPFTGIDNHNKCVTFAVGLIRDEKQETYTWLLKCFMDNFKKEPTMVVTDQDKAMEIGIKNIFKTAKHRLCMWHITQKLPTKIREATPSIEDETERDFKSRFDSIVWNIHMEPKTFEEKWEKLMIDFSLQNDNWFKYMFQIRSKWIPAYFIDTLMCGLMRTTSRSESENAFFSHFTRSASNLVSFMSGFESAMMKQRSKQEKLDAETIKKTPILNTKLKIEMHASKLYTKTIFEMIQKEIEAGLYDCLVAQMTVEEECQIYIINKMLKRKVKETGQNVIQYKVLHNLEDGSVVCTCRQYLRLGLLCRHCFSVLKNNNIDEIHAQYIMRRWTKGIIPPDLRSSRNRFDNGNVGTQKMVAEASSVFEDCLHLVVNDDEKLKEFLERVKSLKSEVEADMANQPPKKKNEVISRMMGVEKPDSNEIKNPPVGVYKGCGTVNRIMAVRRKD
uniref:protein FAR1-RELATED SEQUENCE 5-like n=1 Tax=Erigeron canadensis TaxID=72917 RepID=UPI001CB8FB2D|nr:protein FAR1-RELATED SEQUENCE 5-like [Erigeron canadensis]